MGNSHHILGLIPARGGSKGLPGKNLISLKDRPLIAWTILHARFCPSISRIVVSTDDETIAEVSRAFGADVPFLRPPELSRDDSATVDAIFHALDWFDQQGEHFTHVALLEPTSPLRRFQDAEKALQMLLDREPDAEALVSLGTVHLENPYVMKTLTSTGVVRPLMPPSKVIVRRQDYPVVYFPYGVIYATSVKALRDTKTFYHDRTIGYPIERWQNYEIDDRIDHCVVQAILEEHLKDVFPEECERSCS